MNNPQYPVDIDLPATARAVTKSIDTLVGEVGQLNHRLDEGESKTKFLAFLTVVVSLLAAFGVGMAVYAQSRFDCIRDASRSERAAQVDMLEVVLDPATSVDGRRLALAAYLEIQRAAKAQRQEGGCA